MSYNVYTSLIASFSTHAQLNSYYSLSCCSLGIFKVQSGLRRLHWKKTKKYVLIYGGYRGDGNGNPLASVYGKRFLSVDIFLQA